MSKIPNYPAVLIPKFWKENKVFEANMRCCFWFVYLVLGAGIGFELVCYFEIAYARNTHANVRSFIHRTHYNLPIFHQNIKWCRAQSYNACLEAQDLKGSCLKQSCGAAFQTQSTSTHDFYYSFFWWVDTELSHSLQLQLPSYGRLQRLKVYMRPT